MNLIPMNLIPWEILRWLLVLAGLFMGLLGYKNLRTCLFILGFIFGVSLGTYIGTTFDKVRLGVISGITLGLVFGIGAYIIVKLGLFIAGMLGGVVFINFFASFPSYSLSELETSLLRVGAAISGGLLTRTLYKLSMIIITCLSGLYLIYLGTKEYFISYPGVWQWIFYILILIIFLFVQFQSRKDWRGR